VLSIVPLYLQLIIVQPLQSSRRTNSLAQWIHSSPERETLITQPFPSLSTIVATPSTSNHHPKKTSNPPEAKEPRQHSISGSKCPAKAQAQTALGCCYPEMFCNANVAACLLHRRTKRFMARERGKQCRVRPTRKGHKSVDLAWPLTGFQARFATGFCSSSGREQEWEVLERSGVSYKMRYCSEWRF
jgi:hypothetical protein